MKKNLVFYFFMLSFLLKAQTFDVLSDGLNPYQGGAVAFYKDLNDILIKNKAEKCSQRYSEMFLANINVDSDNQAFLKNNGDKNCAAVVFEKALSDINKLNKWKKNPELQDGFSIIFYPIDYFENFKHGYTTEKLKEYAEFPGGIAELRNQFIKKFKFPKKNLDKDIRYDVFFNVDAEGNMTNLKLSSNSPDTDYEQNILKAFQKIETKWKPEKFRGNPVNSKYRFPVAFPKN